MNGDEKDDTILRAVAAAPPLEPPKRGIGGVRHGPPRRSIATFALVAVIVGIIVAAGSLWHECGTSGGRAIREWTLDVEGRSKNVTLPTTLFGDLPWREIDYTLHARVPLAPEERGDPLTIAFECYHGPLSLQVDGTPLDDIGDVAVGEHRFIIPAASTNRESLAVAVIARQEDSTMFFGFGAAPFIQPGARTTRSATATFNRFLAFGESALLVVVGILFTTLFVLDRRRRADAAFAIQALVTLPIPLWELGIVPAWSAGFFLSFTWIALLYFVHFEFDRGTPPRWLVGLYGLLAVLSLLASQKLALLRLTPFIAVALQVPLNVHVVRQLLGVVRGRARRIDAFMLLAAIAVFLAGYIPWAVTATMGVNVLPGLHLETIGVFSWVIQSTIVLARQHVARQREVERANAELQRQVAERSRDLSDALGKLAQQGAVLSPDRVIAGRYRVVRTLGAGGMGTVYEVERTGDKQRLALKTLRGQADMDLMARFAREAQIAAAIAHPNLVPVIDVGIADGDLFLVMPLIDGGSLEDQRERFGDKTWARPLLVQIASGLAALHERNVVHRDLKPGNVLIDRGVARIADFGLASLAERIDRATRPVGNPALAPTLAHGLTRAGDVFGTPAYMAPELADGVDAPRPSSDVFALGLIAYELLTGSAAFPKAPVLAAMAGEAIVPPASDGVDPIVARCLDLEPVQRPNAAEVVSALGG